jgi:hypothetical protein
MDAEFEDELFTNKHERLQQYAMLANVFAWVIAVGYGLAALAMLRSDWLLQTRELPGEIARNILAGYSKDAVIVFTVLVNSCV